MSPLDQSGECPHAIVVLHVSGSVLLSAWGHTITWVPRVALPRDRSRR